jgi:MFS family permease
MRGRRTLPSSLRSIAMQRFKNRWWVVFAAILGQLVGQGPINVFAFAVFLKPVSEALGMSRGDFSAALIFSTTLSALASPLAGKLMDRWGIRAILLPSIVLFAGATALLSQLRPSLLVLYTLFAFSGFASAGQLPTAYAKAVTAWFDRQRGLALGMTMAGIGLGVTLVPQLSEYLIETVGWQKAYVALGAAIFLIAFPACALFMREPRSGELREGKRKLEPQPERGITTREALTKSWKFWALTIALLFGGVSITGTVTQVVALLTDRGVSAEVATTALSVAGLAMILGRVASGYLLDVVFGPFIAIFFFGSAMIGIAILGSSASGLLALAGAVFCGIGIGSEMDLMSFFVSRYFGLKAFGEIYGYMFCVFSIGTGVGPYLMGASYDLSHSYLPMFAVFEILLACSCILFSRIGPYDFPAESKEAISAPAAIEPQ